MIERHQFHRTTETAFYCALAFAGFLAGLSIGMAIFPVLLDD